MNKKKKFITQLLIHLILSYKRQLLIKDSFLFTNKLKIPNIIS